jgi:purine catabolism regulator
MGVPVTGRQLVAAVVRMPDADPAFAPAFAVLEVAEAVAAGCRNAGVPALVGALDDLRAGALLSLPSAADAGETLTALAGWLLARLGEPAGLVIGAGPSAGALHEVRGSFLEAREVADVAARHPDGRSFYRLSDLRLRGLLHLLRDDARLRAFAGRELGPLVGYDAAHGTSLVSDLAAYLECGGNKALAAARAHLARPTFYERLRHIERVLGVSLADPESRTCLHVALLSLTPDG